MTPILGFTPDMETPTPGMLTDCANFIPYQTGMEGAPSPIAASEVPVLPAACTGTVIAQRLDGTRRFIAGTPNKIYEFVGASWVDRSRAASYTGGLEVRWSFAQFGDSTIAANLTDVIQKSLLGAFADIAGAPKANIVFSVGSFVMALNTNDGAAKPDGWHCCAVFDDTSWTPSIATQASRGRLVATPGVITAGARLGEYAIAYKDRSIYLGQYVGSPVVWDWLLISGGQAGCVGKDAVTDIGGAHFFVGMDNIWIFDGTRPTPVGDGQVRQWFFDNSNPSALFKTKCVFDRQKNRVWVFYPSTGSETVNACLVYHLVSKQWGRAAYVVQEVVNYISPGIAFDSVLTIPDTFNSPPDVPFDSQSFAAGGSTLSFFNTSNTLQLLSGVSASSGFTTGDGGDDEQITTLTRIRLRYADSKRPTTASVQTSFKFELGAAMSSGSSSISTDGKFDLIQTGRWHRAAFTFTGDVKVVAVQPTLKSQGIQ